MSTTTAAEILHRINSIRAAAYGMNVDNGFLPNAGQAAEIARLEVRLVELASR